MLKDFEINILVKYIYILEYYLRCVFCFLLNGDLFVGKYNIYYLVEKDSKVFWYIKIGYLI